MASSSKRKKLLDNEPKDQLSMTTQKLLKYVESSVEHQKNLSWDSNDRKGLIWKAISLLQDSSNSHPTLAKEKDVYKYIYEIMHHCHCTKVGGNTSLFVPLIIWRANASTKDVCLGEFRYPGRFDRNLSIVRDDILSLKHATNADALCDMFRRDGLRLVGRRQTQEKQVADITTQGLLYCGVQGAEEVEHKFAKEFRYGAAIIEFELEKEARVFYKLGTRFFQYEVSQQLFATTKVDEDWKIIYKNYNEYEVRDLTRVDIDSFIWDLGVTEETRTYGIQKWIHPEVVLDGGVDLQYKNVRIHIVDNHKCLTLGPRREDCRECKIRNRKYYQGLKFRNWDEKVKSALKLKDSNSATRWLDIFAMKMVEEKDTWKVVQKHFKIFSIEYEGDIVKGRQFGELLKERVAALKVHYKLRR